jgi:hypothetical protein
MPALEPLANNVVVVIAAAWVTRFKTASMGEVPIPAVVMLSYFVSSQSLQDW